MRDDSNNNIKISIVTVVYNGVNEIEHTINSVISQNFTNYEFIIIDGKSTDGTTEKIKSFSNQIHQFVSEEDQGIYDAMNKGIKLARGEWIYFLNAGDTFYNEDVLKELFLFDFSEDLVYGSNEADYGYFKRINKPQSLSRIHKGMVFSHQGMICRTSLMKKHPFDLSYRMSADYNFIYGLFRKGHQFKQVDIIFATLEARGVSEENIVLTHKERQRIATSYEKGWSKFKLNFWYYIETIRLKMVNFIKWLLPKKTVQKLTQKKYS